MQLELLTISCICFDSYIKPQLVPLELQKVFVVYLLIPTSNHNLDNIRDKSEYVVYLLIPTSNHNCKPDVSLSCMLYIF